MRRHTLRSALAWETDDVVSLLGHRPLDWMRPFLLLSARAVGCSSLPPAGEDWFTIEALRRNEDGMAAFDVQWSPHAGSALFSHFTGEIVVSGVRARGSLLTLDGWTADGDIARNEAALKALLEFLACAVNERQVLTG